MQARFIGSHNQCDMFDFLCSCGYQAELGVPHKFGSRLIACAECAALYVRQKQGGFYGHPVLIEVKLQEVN